MKLSSTTISFKLVFAFIICLIGSSIISVWTIETIKVNGPVYTKIVQGKDLVADILPPPEYIIEPYLVINQLVTAADQKTIDFLISECDRLKKDYYDRHQYWLSNLEDSKIKQLFLEKSYSSADTFFKVLYNEFLPAVKEKNKTHLESLAYGKLKELYLEHRAVGCCSC